MFAHCSSSPLEEGGQGLTEYGFILALVALAVLMSLTFLGQGVMNTYCKITYQFAPLSSPSPCSLPIVTVVVNAQGPNTINVEAIVLDPDGDPADPYGAIDRVKFYIDDTGGGPVQTEYIYRFCLSGNPINQPCGNYNTSGLSPGHHTIIVLAYDDDGNVGRSQINITI